MQRSSKLSAVAFLDLLLYQASREACFSVNQLAIKAKTEYDVDLSKQGLDQRMNWSAVGFIHSLLQAQLSNQVSEVIDENLMQHFNRVRIKDSTKFDLDKQLADYFPGFNGSASSANACIQYEFDIKGGGIMDLDITPGNHPDSKDALEKTDNVEVGDLIIRDLGYFSLGTLADIYSKGAYFLSKLNCKTLVYEADPVGGQLKEIDFEKLYGFMKKNNIQSLEKKVLMGKNEKLPVRLIINLVPEEIYEQRVRNIHKQNKKKGHKTSSDYLNRSRLNLLVTNVPDDILTAASIPLFYKIRWQVELVFKAWKSTFGIHVTRKMKLERFMCLIYSKLLLIMVNWECNNVFKVYLLFDALQMAEY